MTFVTFESLRSAACQNCPEARTYSPNGVAELPTASLSPRTEVLRLGALVGDLCISILNHAPLDPPRDVLSPEMAEDESFPPTLADRGFWSEKSAGKDEIAAAMGSVFLALFVAAQACRLDLRVCILKKMELNNRKYPVELCKGKSGKYTAYSDQTGITKTDGQSTVHTSPKESLSSPENGGRNIEVQTSTETIEGITAHIRRFATDRSWSRYHTPRNVALALMGELGELAELFQWRGDAPGGAPEGLIGWSETDRDKVSQELADVSIYLLRLADVCGIGLGQAALRAANENGNEI